MLVIQCDLCRKELTPREKGNYDWFSKGGMVVLVGREGHRVPSRLQHEGKDVNEVCSACVGKCVARAWIDPRDRGPEIPASTVC
jgi:ribosomal protein L2